MKERLLEVLKKNNPGGFISGEELSRLLNISRAAVWKHINSLREKGYTIEARTKRGYRLTGGPDRILAGDIVPSGEVGCRKVVLAKVISTNETAKELAQKGYPHGTLVFAEEQEGGRGRLGRSWYSPPGTGLWMTLLLRPPLPAWEVPKINLVVAVALAESLRFYPGIEAMIKWPNDILCQGRKIAGILTEMQAETDAVNFVVIGIGININADSGEFPPEIREKATSLADCLGQAVDRKTVLNNFLASMNLWYRIFLEGGFAPVRERWKELSGTLGKAVTVTTARGTLEGDATDLTPDGALLVRDAEGTVHTVHSGDIVEKA